MPAPDDLTERLDAAAGAPPDVDAGLASVRARLATKPGRRVAEARRWGRPALVAAVTILLAGTAIAVSVGRDDPSTTVRTLGVDNTSTSVAAENEADGTSPAGPVTFQVLEVASSDGQPMGTLRAATDQDALDRLWADTGTENPTPPVDLLEQLVISITIPDDACPPELEGFERQGTTLEPRFVETSTICNQPLIQKTYVVALAWASTGPSFRLFLPGQPSYDFDDTSLEVTRPTPRPSSEPTFLSVRLPKRTIALQLTDEASAANPTIRYQAGFQRDGYGYDIEVSVDDGGLDPCLGATPCEEVGTGYETAGGLQVRKWAPNLVVRQPSAPVYVTATSKGGVTLTLRAVYAGGALTGAEIAGMLVVDPARWLGLGLGSDRQALSWNGTIVNASSTDGTLPWSVYLGPTCEGAETCEDGVGISSLTQGNTTPRPLSDLVSQASSMPT